MSNSNGNKKSRSLFTEEKFFMSKDFKDTQNEWYDKLKEDGFKDLEWLDKTTGRGQNSDYLKSNGYLDYKKSQNSHQLFRILGLFVHSEAFLRLIPKKKHKTYQFLLNNYINGESYRGLVKLINKSRHRKRISPTRPKRLSQYALTEIHYTMRSLIDTALKWYDESEIDE